MAQYKPPPQLPDSMADLLPDGVQDLALDFSPS